MRTVNQLVHSLKACYFKIYYLKKRIKNVKWYVEELHQDLKKAKIEEKHIQIDKLYKQATGKIRNPIFHRLLINGLQVMKEEDYRIEESGKVSFINYALKDASNLILIEYPGLNLCDKHYFDSTKDIYIRKA